MLPPNPSEHANKCAWERALTDWALTVYQDRDSLAAAYANMTVTAYGRERKLMAELDEWRTRRGLGFVAWNAILDPETERLIDEYQASQERLTTSLNSVVPPEM